MKFVIIGAGSVGTNLAERLAQSENDVVLIEKEQHVIDNVPADLDLQIIHGNGCDPDLLISAGIKDSDYVMAVTNNDEVNIAAGLIARLINPEAKRIARIRDLHLDNEEIDQSELDQVFDLIINPPKVAAKQLANILKVPGSQDIISFAGGRLMVLATEVAKNSEVAGKKISSLSDIKDKYPLLLNAIVRDETLIVPRGTDRIHEGDLVYFITYPEHVSELVKLTGRPFDQLKNIMICGDTPVARNLAHFLEDDHCNVKLIVPKKTGSYELLEEFHNTLIIKGDSSDARLLEEENISGVDAFIAFGQNEEQNIMSAILSKKLGAKFSVASVNSPLYIPLVRNMGVDSVVSVQLAAALAIVRFIYSGSILSASSLVHTDANYIEFIVEKKHLFTNKTIKDLKLPYGVLICAIIRKTDKGTEVTIPRGEDIIEEKDRVVVFFIQSALKKVEDMLNIKLELFH